MGTLTACMIRARRRIAAWLTAMHLGGETAIWTSAS